MRKGRFTFPNSSPPVWAESIPDAEPVAIHDLPQGCSSGVVATAPLIEMNRYMPWMMARLKDLDGLVKKRTVMSFDSITNSADAIVNTTGLGAAKLTGDTPFIRYEEGSYASSKLGSISSPGVKQGIGRTIYFLVRMT